jgi:hypothetical protein
VTAILAWGLLRAYARLCRNPRLPGARALLLWSLRRARSGNEGTRAAPPAALAHAETVARVARGLGHAPPCLARALALQTLLAWGGIPSRVRLGLRWTAAGLAGHAWVECGGRPVGEDAARIAAYVACEPS